MNYEYYGGIGFDEMPEIGVYEVRDYFDAKVYTRLSLAKNYYDTIQGEKAIWKIDGHPELIDAWHYTGKIESDDLPF